ncbi:MAG: YhfC family intramembrane metalloprotease [Ruminococcus sp.]|nr:YhfC family intramembrane metalloprotease [Ruminococcus sp.]
MKDVSCFLAGAAWLMLAPAALIYWHKRTRTPFFPAFIALPVCFAAFFFAGIIRSGFGSINFVLACIRNGLLYGVFEEGAKFLALRFALMEYATASNAVTYSIGHGAYESFGAAVSCFALIGKGTASPYILPLNLWAVTEGTLSCAAVTVIIVYGIRTNKSRYTLPAAIALHAVSNAAGHMFITPVAITLRSLQTAGECYAAYRLENRDKK